MNKNILLVAAFSCFAAFGFAQIKVVAPNGDVGIGTSNPTEKLDVAGFIALSSPETGGSTFENRNHVIYGLNGSKNLQFSTNASTSLSWSYVQMFGDATCASCTGLAARRGEFVFGGQYFQWRTGSTGNSFGTIGMELKANDDLYVSGDIYAMGVLVSSDRRLKKSIENYELGLNEVLKLDPKKYYYNGDGGISSTKRQHVGLIAQDLKNVVPSAVVDYKHEDLALDINENYLAVDENQIKFMLINSVKELKHELDEKNSRISDLEDRLLKIENMLSSSDGKTTVILSNNGINQSFIEQNNPNPFSESSLINYQIEDGFAKASFKVTTAEGKALKTVDLYSAKGQIELEAYELSSGVYYYSLIVDGKLIETKRFVISN